MAGALQPAIKTVAASTQQTDFTCSSTPDHAFLCGIPAIINQVTCQGILEVKHSSLNSPFPVQIRLVLVGFAVAFIQAVFHALRKLLVLAGCFSADIRRRSLDALDHGPGSLFPAAFTLEF